MQMSRRYFIWLFNKIKIKDHFGEYCESKKCKKECFNGNCDNKTGNCVCCTGYGEDDCSKKICENDCNYNV